ncbi:hypothetical protein D1007_11554 [Hordeum vulgare]|nr:hypothetical protein D1007_11554 [Hordeum vulgare]
MFAIIYMEFVEVPRLLASEHRIDYSLPRSCFVCNDDFKLIGEIDRNKLSLDKIDFGKQNITSHMIPIYDKHKKLHATEVKKVLKSFGYILEEMFCKRLASILVEDNATTTSNNDHMPEDLTFHAPAGNGADVDHTRAPIHTSPEAHTSHAPQEVDVDREVAGCTNTNQHEAQQDIGLEKMQSCCFQGMEDAQEGPVIGEREKLVGPEVVEGYLKDPDDVDEGESVILSHNTVFAFQGPALEFDDGPSMSLFKEGTDDFECLNMDDDTARKYKEANKGMETPTHVSAGPTYDNTPKHAISARSKHVKKAVKKRTYQPLVGAQKMKKIKIEPKDDALYQQYVLSSPDFIEIEGFHTSLENFHAPLNPRADIDSEIITLYLKTSNVEKMYNRKKPKKFAFSVFMGTQLVVDPGLFSPKICEREFQRACENNQITKSDLLFVVVIQNRHWAVVVANLMHKQFNVFDSIKNSEDVTLLKNATNNVSTNIKKVANRESAFKFDLNFFEIFTQVYLTQETHYNCGSYAILYLENYIGVVMMHFNETYIPNLRKRIVENILKHPSNNLDPVEQLRKLLEV